MTATPLKLKGLDGNATAVHNEFGGHVAGDFFTLDIKLQQFEFMVCSDMASSPGTAAATFPEGLGNVMAAQAYEVKTPRRPFRASAKVAPVYMRSWRRWLRSHATAQTSTR